MLNLETILHIFHYFGLVGKSENKNFVCNCVIFQLPIPLSFHCALLAVVFLYLRQEWVWFLKEPHAQCIM